MINIHLALDEKFVDCSVEIFEKYYPNQNIFIVDKCEGENRFVTSKENVYLWPFNSSHWHNLLQKEVSFDDTQRINVLVHFLTKDSARRALELKKINKKVRLYWIFYGADLYSYLELTGRYKLYDYNVSGQRNRLKDFISLLLGRYNYIRDFCAELDFFCFWNKYDYELLCKNVETKAKFKLFYYISANARYINDYMPEKEMSVLINHSASLTGNHLTLINKLNSLSVFDINLIFPLSYGSIKHRNLIESNANKLFPGRCVFLEDYMPTDAYYKIINKCQIAIMGHRRQEAGGNINFLLRNGKKVFLREDNNLLRYYRDLGCFVYSFEKDLNSRDDLRPLAKEQQEVNKRIMSERISSEKIDDMMLNLFKY